MIEYPSDWRVASFSDVFSHQKTRGYQLQSKEVAVHGDLPVVDQGKDYIVGYTNDLSLKFTVPSSGVIVFGDHTRIVKYVDFDFCVGADGTQVLACKNGADTRYIYYLMQDLEIPNLGYSRHFKYVKAGRYALPPLPEQKRIAKVLDDVDRLIENLGKRIVKKRLIKKGVSQELLTGKRRLPGFAGEWKTVKLGDVATMFSGGTPSSSVAEFYGGQIPWVSITDITIAGKYLDKTQTNLSQLGYDNCSARMYPPNTILFAMYASIGKCCIARKPVCSSQAILGVYDLQNVDLHYLYQNLSSREREFVLMGQTGTQSNLSKKIVSEILLLLPALPEQRAIAKVLSDMDAEIANLEARQAKLKLVKKGLLQDLLTGKVRI